MRIILLVDMDYFFVACEEIRRPELREKPTIVGADPKEGKGRGVVMTCNYAARRFGIHSAMPISAAYRLKPDANFLPMDYAYYEQKSREVIGILKTYSLKIEQVSIDEAFVDISDQVPDYDAAIKYAEEIKIAIGEKAKLPCSIGASANKLLAKMACEAAKPNGVRLVKGEDGKKFLEALPVRKLYGIGEKTSERLEKMKIKTVGELARANKMTLLDKFGQMGLWLHNAANGIDEEELVYDYEAKSIGREKTFEDDTNDEKLVAAVIGELSEEVFRETVVLGVSFKNVTLKLRYSDFSEHLKSRSIKPSNDLAAITENALQLYRKSADPERKIRKLGVRVSELTNYKKQKGLASFL